MIVPGAQARSDVFGDGNGKRADPGPHVVFLRVATGVMPWV